MFVIACWTTFMMAALKCLLNISNICVNLMVSIDCLFSFELRFFLFFVWQVFLDCVQDIYNIILSDSRFYLNPMENVDIFLLADNQPIL